MIQTHKLLTIFVKIQKFITFFHENGPKSCYQIHFVCKGDKRATLTNPDTRKGSVMEYNGTNLVLLMLHKCQDHPHLFPLKIQNETENRYFSTVQECKGNNSDFRSSYVGRFTNLVSNLKGGEVNLKNGELDNEGKKYCQNLNHGFDFGVRGKKHVNWQREVIDTNQMCFDYEFDRRADRYECLVRLEKHVSPSIFPQGHSKAWCQSSNSESTLIRKSTFTSLISLLLFIKIY